MVRPAVAQWLGPTVTAALCLTCDAGYLPYASVVAKKALALASRPLPIIILCHEIPEGSFAVGQGLCRGDSVFFVDASAKLASLNLSVAPHITKAAYLRLFVDLIPELLQFSKIMYVDCDVHFLRDPCQLADVELAAAPILAAYDMRYLSSADHRSYLPMPDGSPYFNSGVLVFDMERIRREGQLERARRFASDFPQLCINHDQDALNVGFSDGWQTMDWRWNTVSMFQDLLPHDAFFLRHFTGPKPWGKLKAGIERKFVTEWRQALGNSPWPEKFQEMNARQRIRGILRPLGQRLEMAVKNSLYDRVLAKANPRRERRAHLARKLQTALSRIEDDARQLRLARRMPEYSLID